MRAVLLLASLPLVLALVPPATAQADYPCDIAACIDDGDGTGACGGLRFQAACVVDHATPGACESNDGGGTAAAAGLAVFAGAGLIRSCWHGVRTDIAMASVFFVVGYAGVYWETVDDGQADRERFLVLTGVSVPVVGHGAGGTVTWRDAHGTSDDGCRLEAYAWEGGVVGASREAQVSCPAGPPRTPTGPWGTLLP